MSLTVTCPHCGATDDVSEFIEEMDCQPDANVVEAECATCTSIYFVDVWVEISTAIAGVAKTADDADSHGPTWVKAANQ